MQDPIDYWLFHDEFTVVQAALLIVGVDPSITQDYIFTNTKRPEGFDAIFSAITKAINSKKLNATVRYAAHPQGIEEGWAEEPGDDEKMEQFSRWPENSQIEHKTIVYKVLPEWRSTTIEVDDLKKWLLSRNFKPSFFFSETTDAPDYLNKDHPRYSAKLAAAVNVWLAMEDDNLLTGKATKTAITSWLEARYKELSLVYNGKINTTGIEECTNVANWNNKGGATKTPTN